MSTEKLNIGDFKILKPSPKGGMTVPGGTPTPGGGGGGTPPKDPPNVTTYKGKKKPGEKPEPGQPKPGQPKPGQGQPKPGQPKPGQPKPGQGQPKPGQGQPKPGQGQPKPGQPKPGQGQPGQGQPGQGQPGQGQPKPGQGQPEGGNGQPNFTDDANLMDDIPHVGDEAAKGGVVRDPTNSIGRKIKNKAKEYKTKKKSIIHKKKLDWDSLTNSALSRNSGTLSEEAKRRLRQFKGTEPLVNWKKELKKFFDNSFKADEWVMPNKRFLASGNVLYGRKSVGDDTLKTIVAAVDTSGSISNEQAKAFVNEIMYLCKTFDADKTIIIYCSDQIDGVDTIKKGGKPDFTKLKSTGGNACGFIPPFQYVEKNNIKPSLFIYLTDTGGDMPDPSMYGIKKYIKKVMWFICSPKMYNPPSFGKILFAPVGSIRIA